MASLSLARLEIYNHVSILRERMETAGAEGEDHDECRMALIRDLSFLLCLIVWYDRASVVLASHDLIPELDRLHGTTI